MYKSEIFKYLTIILVWHIPWPTLSPGDSRPIVKPEAIDINASDYLSVYTQMTISLTYLFLLLSLFRRRQVWRKHRGPIP